MTTKTTKTAAASTEKDGIEINITLNEKGAPAMKLADAEIVFTSGILAGLRLLGFAVWESRASDSARGLNVTFPARAYSVNGERRNFALLRPADGKHHIASLPHDSQAGIREAILDKYLAVAYAPCKSCDRREEREGDSIRPIVLTDGICRACRDAAAEAKR